MTDSLIILPATDGGLAMVARRSGDAIETERGALDAVRARLSGRYAAILPGQLVRGLETDLPGKVKATERLSIARFAHEDRIAGDPDGLHVVVGSGNPAATAIVANDVMDDVLGALDPAVLISDFDGLAALGDDPVRVLDRVVTPGPAGHALDADWVDGPVERLDDAALARALFERIESGQALNLRSGIYRRRAALKAGAWGRVAALVLACAGLGLGVSLADARATTLHAEQIEADARALYEARSGQPAPAVLATLARNAAPTDVPTTQFLDLSQMLFTAIAATPGTQVDRLSYETRDGTLRLRLIYPGFDAAAQLEAAVAQAGGQLTTGGVREQNGVFIGDAALVGGGS